MKIYTNALRLFGIIMLLVCSITVVYGQEAVMVQQVGGNRFTDWHGTAKSATDGLKLAAGQQQTYTYPDGKTYLKGFRVIHNTSADWSVFSGLRFEVYLAGDKAVEADVYFRVAKERSGYLAPEAHAQIRLLKKGWNTVMLPWSVFNLDAGQRIAALQEVKELTVLVRTGSFTITKAELVKGELIGLDAPLQSLSAPKGQQVTYRIKVGNTTSAKQSVVLSCQKTGWESMETTISPAVFDLAPREVKEITVRVKVSGRSPAGSREKQVIQALVNGRLQADNRMELITVSRLSGPSILHTAERWKEVRAKVAAYPWAKEEQDKYIQLAADWKVPEVATTLSDDNTDKGMHLFRTQEEFGLMAAGIAFQLTGEKIYAQKVALFMRRLSDPRKGYPSTFRACSQSFVQEGHFFQHIAMAYDMVAESGVFSEEDKRNIEHTFRLFIETVDLDMHQGAINNWKLSEMCGALYAALAIQDWHLAENILYSPSAIQDHLAQGVMNDGWWYECSVGYNVWCATEFSQVALALEPWGEDFKNKKVPIGTTTFYSLMPDTKHGTGKYGMNFDKWGPVTKNSIGIKDMWDALPSFADYRGVMFGVNDAQETLVAGQGYELAYYLYRDPEYAVIIARGKTRDLLYGVPELPVVTSKLQQQSAHADNIGIVMLRSQKEGRQQSEQIQAALHYGTHGGAHGHFDRTGLLSLMRYGRSFFNPEAVWFGYPSYLYKFYVQTSMTKNMVVVDQKMQEAVESSNSLFYSGKMMQASMVETNARWSNPPYGGMIYDWAGNATFAEKMLQEGQSVFVPKVHPAYGEVTGFTGPVIQKRLMIVTDDYVVLSDFLKSDTARTFDNLFQIKGYQGLEAEDKQFIRHDGQMNTDPLGSAQFITDCDWWNVKGTSKSTFMMGWGKAFDNAGTRAPNSEDGVLKIDVNSVWPKQKEIMVGTIAESHPIAKQVSYKVSAGNAVLKEGKTGTWILGAVPIDIPLNKQQELKLETTSSNGQTNTLFWADARIVLEDGKEIFLADLPLKTKNVVPALPGKDYYNGPLKIEGNRYEHAVAAMPTDIKGAAVSVFDLSGLKAKAFKAILGGDYPLGNEEPRRKTYAIRTKGKVARFLTVLEPYEKTAVIKKIDAVSADQLVVELMDGRVQEITIRHLEESGGKLEVSITEKVDGKIVRREVTHD